MRFAAPLVTGRLVRRYKRFLADVRLASGETVVAHCPNPGAMLGLTDADTEVWLSRSDDPSRVLPWSWELAAHQGGLVGINTARPNRLAEEAIAAGALAELSGYDTIRREVKYGENSRVDLVLGRRSGEQCYVEVKNVHLMRERGLAEFPDCVTARGAKHIKELAGLASKGVRAVVLFVVQRQDARSFAVAGDLDPVFATGLKAARTAGVEALCYGCALSPEQIVLDKSLPIAA